MDSISASQACNHDRLVPAVREFGAATGNVAVSDSPHERGTIAEHVTTDRSVRVGGCNCQLPSVWIPA